MLKKRLVLCLFLALMAVIPFMSVAAQDAPTQTIVEIAAGNPDFSTLVTLVEAAGLVDALSGTDMLTVFAPTNDAFAAIPQFVVDYLLAHPEDLTRILTYHVVPGALQAADVLAAATLTTLEGGDLTVNADLARVNGANITATDIMATNGVIHVIDSVVIPTFDLPAVDPLAISDNIVTAGSSTVFPVTQRMADRFNADGFIGTITVDSVGTGAGFERFCVNAETDISNASRPIRQGEIDSCVANGRNPIEFQVGVDALTVVVSAQNDFVTDLTTEQLLAIFSGVATSWDQVDPSFPAQPIQVFSPGSDSGTFDFLVEVILDDNPDLLLNIPGVQLSENDNVLVQGVQASPYAIGYFGFAYFLENDDVLKAVAVNGVEPNTATAESGEYLLSRPLFIYSDATIMTDKPQVAAFINYYLTNFPAELGTGDGQIGYFAPNSDIINLDKLKWIAATSMGM